eukprot:1155891-Pelagomonas_calceolata.AAC.2
MGPARRWKLLLLLAFRRKQLLPASASALSLVTFRCRTQAPECGTGVPEHKMGSATQRDASCLITIL